MFKKRKLAQAQAQRNAELTLFTNTLIAEDGSLSLENEQRWTKYLFEHGYGDEDANVISAELPEDVVNEVLLGKANDGRFTEVAEVGLLLKQGEVAYYEKAAGLLKEVTDREFRGGSRGVSVPLGHGGFRFRTGSFRGHVVTIGSHFEVADQGYLTVTDRRVVFHGGRKTLEFLYTKLATLNVYTDALDLGVTNRQTTSSFRLEDPEFVAGMIRAAFNASTGGTRPSATPATAQVTDAAVHLIEDTHTFEGDEGRTIWCGGLAPCTADGTFIHESEHRTTHPDVLFCKVAGAGHRREALQAAAFAPGSQIRLRPEPDNAYDKNAVQIIDLSGELFVGYVPAELSREVSDLMRTTDVGGQVIREFRLDSEQGERIGLQVLIAPAGRKLTLTIHDPDDFD